MLFLVVAIFSVVVVSALTNTNSATQRQLKTLAVLAQGKQALIDWSVLQGDIGSGTNPRPGTLPCPDTTNLGTQAASCAQASGTTIGRLPWKTLGIEELHDADGEPLWYALSNSFRRPGLNNVSINSDTSGTFQLYAADGITLLTPAGDEFAAVIFSAGSPLTGQDRVAGPNVAANYLDSGNGRNNATAAGPFITGPAKNVSGDIIVNDTLIGIRAKDLIAALEKRALKEAQNALALFAAFPPNANKVPNPANYNGANCTSTISNVGSPTTCNADPTTCFGRLPEDLLSPYVAPWFQQNGWGRVITFAVNKNDALDNTGTNCSTSLNVGGQAKRYVLVAPGTPRSGQTRPSALLSNYLEDSENYDAWTSSVDQPTFSAPSTASNDQLRSMP